MTFVQLIQLAKEEYESNCRIDPTLLSPAKRKFKDPVRNPTSKLSVPVVNLHEKKSGQQTADNDKANQRQKRFKSELATANHKSSVIRK